MQWDRCRFKWYLSRYKRIEYRYIGKKHLAACVGKAVGGVLAMKYNPTESVVASMNPTDLADLATEYYNVELDALLQSGLELCGSPEEVKYPALIPDMLKAYLKKPCVLPEWTVKGTEYQCGAENIAFIDIWGENDRGIWVIDWKCKMTARPYQITQELAKYKQSWQLGHYVWSLHERIGDWPKTAGISLIVGEPIATHQYMEFEVDLEYMKWWQVTASRLWGEIDAAREWLDARPGVSIEEVKAYLGMSTSHMDGIFTCDMLEPCMTYGGDVQGIDNYVEVKELKKPSGTTSN